MSRSERLLDLIQILRRHRRPVSGRTLAGEMGVSIRTLYRDIATLQGQGAPIEGEAGLGYVLKPGFMLPPLMFTDEEVEAIVLGSRWVAKQPDKRLAVAATERVVWPFALGFFDKVRVMVAWCEMRQDFRHFRADRVSRLAASDIRYPRRRQAMLKEWRATLDRPGRKAPGESAG